MIRTKHNNDNKNDISINDHCICIIVNLWSISLTTPVNKMQTLKFKAYPANAFLASVNQTFGGSSQLPTTAEREVIKSNRRAQFRKQSRKLGGAAEHLIGGNEKRIWSKSGQHIDLFSVYCFGPFRGPSDTH